MNPSHAHHAACTSMEDLARKLSKEEINDLPVRRWEGAIQLVRSPEEQLQAVEALSRHPLLGFDTETPPSFRKGTSHLPTLVQLASSEAVYLFLLRQLPDKTPLAGLLGNPAILKAGVSLEYDIKQLQHVFSFQPAGFVDLGDAAKGHGIGSHGLRTMAAALLGIRISKRAQCSNWASQELKDYQIEYAATDAWISLELYHSLNRLGVNLAAA